MRALPFLVLLSPGLAGYSSIPLPLGRHPGDLRFRAREGDFRVVTLWTVVTARQDIVH